jgi:DNA-binding GntR family transcriptional regulator
VVCSYRVLDEWGVKRHAAYRALKALEREGLIQVIRGPGRSPRVTLLQHVTGCLPTSESETRRGCDASTLG